MQFKKVTTALIIVALFLMKLCSLSAQEKSALNGIEVLKRSIAFHDPKGNWPSFHQKLYFHAKEPEDTAIYEQVFLDNRVSFFGHISKMDGKKIEKGVRDTIFFSSINGDTSITAEDRKKYRLSKRAITSARNSYLFLYGLPMKMLDNGITIRPEVEIDTFNGKKYYVIKADFDKKIGNDSWMLYINPATFAMEGYRFSHNRKPNDGEYIICQNTINIQGIKIPQVRYWHSNADGSYIATDIVEKAAPYSWSKKKGNALPQ
ncbi:MAG: DUF6503 family protein [Saprospiraceae bacterium]